MLRFKPTLLLMSAAALGAATPPAEGGCARAVENPALLNVREIVAGYTACEEECRAEDAAFLLLLGMIRATTDFAVLQPSHSVDIFEDPSVLPVLQLANVDMDPDFSRDVAGFDRMLRRVREARLGGPPEYAPGWDVAPSAKHELYDLFLNGLRESVLATEVYLAGLLRDDRYYTAYVERGQIIEQFQEGDRLGDRYGELGELMLRVVAELGDPPSSGPMVPWRLLYEPGPKSGFV